MNAAFIFLWPLKYCFCTHCCTVSELNVATFANMFNFWQHWLIQHQPHQTTLCFCLGFARTTLNLSNHNYIKKKKRKSGFFNTYTSRTAEPIVMTFDSLDLSVIQNTEYLIKHFKINERKPTHRHYSFPAKYTNFKLK